EKRVPAILAEGEPPRVAGDDAAIQRFDPVPGYLRTLAERIDVNAIKDAGLRIAYDPMYGTGAGLLSELLAGGRTTVTEIHTDRNPLFPGLRAPEPIDANLGELMRMLAGGRFDIGIATDGDSDRLGAVDEQGQYIDQLRTFA